MASASVLFTRFDHGVGLIWGATAILVARLLTLSRKAWLAPLIVCGIANAIVIAAFGLGPRFALPMTLVSLSEAVVAVVLLKRWNGGSDPLGDIHSLARLTVALGLIAPGVRALLGLATTGLIIGIGPRAFQSAFEVFTSHALGALILTPLLMLASRASIKEWWDKSNGARRRDAVLLLALMAATSLGVFSQTRFPLLFLPLLPMQLAAFRLGRFGAAASLALLAVVGGVMSLLGYGPMHLMKGSMTERAWFLQFYLVTATLIALPTAAELSRRRRLWRALADAEHRYRMLADNSGDMIVRIGLDGVRRYVSPACRTLLGYEPDELVGATPAGQIHPEDRGTVTATCQTLLDGVQEPIATYRQRRKDGSYIWLEASYRLVRDPVTDEPTEFIASVRDLASRHAADLERAEAAARLTASHRLLSMAEQVGQIGHWYVDVVGRTVFWSDVVCAIHGKPSGYAPPFAHAGDFYTPEDRVLAARHTLHTLRTGTGFDFEAWIVRNDGSRRRVTVRGRADLAPNGEVIGLVGVMQDITDLHEAIHALEESEARYRIIADRGGDIVLTIDVDGTVRYASPSIEQLSGFTVDAVVGRTAQDFIWHEDVPAVTAAHFRAVKEPDSTHIFDYRIQIASGELRWFETHTRAIVNADGATTGVVSAMRDVTERKQAETELRTAASTDPLTGLANRRQFDAMLGRLLGGARDKSAEPACLVMIDIDHFKQVNDRHGHDVGDMVLRAVADTLARETRDCDLVARLGGEEFAMLLTDVSSGQARAICERIRGLVRDETVRTPVNDQVRVTISLGMTTIDAGGDAELVKRQADVALYAAKRAGRNCLKLAA